MFIYLLRDRDRDREREREQAREGEREIPSRLLAVSTEPDVGLQLTNCEIMI